MRMQQNVKFLAHLTHNKCSIKGRLKMGCSSLFRNFLSEALDSTGGIISSQHNLLIDHDVAMCDGITFYTIHH